MLSWYNSCCLRKMCFLLFRQLYTPAYRKFSFSVGPPCPWGSGVLEPAEMKTCILFVFQSSLRSIFFQIVFSAFFPHFPNSCSASKDVISPSLQRSKCPKNRLFLALRDDPGRYLQWSERLAEDMRWAISARTTDWSTNLPKSTSDTRTCTTVFIWPAGFRGSFNPSFPLRVWFSLVKLSLEICSDTP